MNNSIYSLNKLKELARRLDRENNHTPCHSENVAGLAMDLCRALNIRGAKKDLIITACLIHDVGKVAVDPEVWAKRDRLTEPENVKTRLHPVISAKIAQAAMAGKPVIEAVYYHHVWFNGQGYPSEAYKKGTRIPIGARILAVCDAYESMISNRAYRDKVSREEAIEELQKSSIKQFDPKIVEAFVGVIIGEKNN